MISAVVLEAPATQAKIRARGKLFGRPVDAVRVHSVMIRAALIRNKRSATKSDWRRIVQHDSN
jgi:hypothetical protein